MPDIETDVSPESMVRANEANYAAAMLGFARAYGGKVIEAPDLNWFTTGLPVGFLNGVVNANLAPDAIDERVDWVLEQARAAGVPFDWALGPSSRPSDLGEYLVRHGITAVGDTPAMSVDLAVLPNAPTLPAGAAVERVRDLESLKEWARVSAIGFGFDDSALATFEEITSRDDLSEDAANSYYIARINGEAVATSAMTPAAGVAGIYAVATLKQARRQGIGSAVTLTPLLEARAKGYRIGILQASSMGYPIYARMGFKEYFRYRDYHWEPS